jgi:hypothetical protein
VQKKNGVLTILKNVLNVQKKAGDILKNNEKKALISVVDLPCPAWTLDGVVGNVLMMIDFFIFSI